eukprot:229195_1
MMVLQTTHYCGVDLQLRYHYADTNRFHHYMYQFIINQFPNSNQLSNLRCKYIIILSDLLLLIFLLFDTILRTLLYGDTTYGFINFALVNCICDSSSISRN